MAGNKLKQIVQNCFYYCLDNLINKKGLDLKNILIKFCKNSIQYGRFKYYFPKINSYVKNYNGSKY